MIIHRTKAQNRRAHHTEQAQHPYSTVEAQMIGSRITPSALLHPTFRTMETIPDRILQTPPTQLLREFLQTQFRIFSSFLPQLSQENLEILHSRSGLRILDCCESTPATLSEILLVLLHPGLQGQSVPFFQKLCLRSEEIQDIGVGEGRGSEILFPPWLGAQELTQPRLETGSTRALGCLVGCIESVELREEEHKKKANQSNDEDKRLEP